MVKIFLTFAALLALHGVSADVSDEEPISLKDLEDVKAGRLMKGEGLDPQATYHEEDPVVMEDFKDDKAARIVKNRGPITARITANGSHSNYCQSDSDKPGCEVDFSLIAWKFAGEEGEIKGSIEEKFKSGAGLKVDVDCLQRKDNVAIVGGVVTSVDNSKDEKLLNTRAYVKVEDGEGAGIPHDKVSRLAAGLSEDTDCMSYFDELEKDWDMHQLEVRVCSKRAGNWEECIGRMKDVA